MGAPASPSATSPGMTSPSATSPGATDTSQTVAIVCKDMGVTVSFNTDSYTLDVNAKGALDGVTKWMQARPGRTLKLRGYADPTGSPEANLTLSEKRADAAKTYLIEQGIDPMRISTIGLGEEHPELRTLPNEGRTVTFWGCSPPIVAEATPEAAPPPPPAPVEETPPPPPVAAEPMPTAPMPPQGEANPAYLYGSKYGFAFVVGGGYTDFTRTAARNLTSAGGGWDARIIGGTRYFVGFEAAYVGTANNLPSLGNTTSTLVSNGVEGALRINAPIVRGFSLFEPYLFGGLGWSSYHVTNNRPAFSSFSTNSDNVMTVPAGGGFAYIYKAFMADIRGSWTGTYFNNIILPNTSVSPNNANNRLDHWQAGGNIGVAF
jgi:peptidoglycan-associated lipoprotein